MLRTYYLVGPLAADDGDPPAIDECGRGISRQMDSALMLMHEEDKSCEQGMRSALALAMTSPWLI